MNATVQSMHHMDAYAFTECVAIRCESGMSEYDAIQLTMSEQAPEPYVKPESESVSRFNLNRELTDTLLKRFVPSTTLHKKHALPQQ